MESAPGLCFERYCLAWRQAAKAPPPVTKTPESSRGVFNIRCGNKLITMRKQEKRKSLPSAAQALSFFVAVQSQAPWSVQPGACSKAAWNMCPAFAFVFLFAFSFVFAFAPYYMLCAASAQSGLDSYKSSAGIRSERLHGLAYWRHSSISCSA